jgi:hypothetical protein
VGQLERNRLVLILSERPIQSDWAQREVLSAMEEERKRGKAILSPCGWTTL